MLNKDILTWVVGHTLSELGRILETTKSDTNFIGDTTPKTHFGAGVYLLERKGFAFVFVFYVKA